MMLRNQTFSLIISMVACLAISAGTLGCKRLSEHVSDRKEQELGETLDGRWKVDTGDVERFELGSDDLREMRNNPDGDSMNSSLMLAAALGIEVALEFSADGDFSLQIGEERLDGTWSIPQKDGDRYVFVTEFPMRNALGNAQVEGIDPESTKTLVERLHLIDESTIEIEDDEGNRFRFRRVTPEEGSES